jgi:hypothetical protein
MTNRSLGVAQGMQAGHGHVTHLRARTEPVAWFSTEQGRTAQHSTKPCLAALSEAFHSSVELS